MVCSVCSSGCSGRIQVGAYVESAQLSAAVIVSAPRQGREQDDVTYMYWHVAHRTCGCALLNIGTTSLRMMSMAIEERRQVKGELAR